MNLITIQKIIKDKIKIGLIFKKILDKNNAV